MVVEESVIGDAEIFNVVGETYVYPSTSPQYLLHWWDLKSDKIYKLKYTARLATASSVQSLQLLINGYAASGYYTTGGAQTAILIGPTIGTNSYSVLCGETIITPSDVGPGKYIWFDQGVNVEPSVTKQKKYSSGGYVLSASGDLTHFTLYPTGGITFYGKFQLLEEADII